MLAPVLFNFNVAPLDQTTDEVSFLLDILRRFMYTFFHLYNKY